MVDMIADALIKELKEEYTLKKGVCITLPIYVGCFEDESDRFDIYEQMRKYTGYAAENVCMSGKYREFYYTINSNFIYNNSQNIEITFTIIRRGDEW